MALNSIVEPPDIQRFQQTSLMVGQVFNPNTPVSEKDMFSGRIEQIQRTIDVIFQKGQHVIIFGERGVGKTSLANVLSSFVSQPIALLPARINCDRSDSFASVWRKAFEELNLVINKPGIGFKATNQPASISVDEIFPSGEVAPNDVRKALIQLSYHALPLLIIDEFDRLDEEVRKLFADLIKSLSDYALNATIVLIGVGDSLEQLINEHQSVSRALVQIQMPRMTNNEIKAIVNTALLKLNMTIDPDVLDQIALLSKGLPHYTHLIGLHATRDALHNFSMNVTTENLNRAIEKAIKDSQHSIKTEYLRAIKSAYKESLFADVLLACALAEVNDLGEFAATDLRKPMHKIKGKNYGISQYSQHLKEFSEEKRGKILLKSGGRRLYRYKFADPLMQPFIIMQGILCKKIVNRTLL